MKRPSLKIIRAGLDLAALFLAGTQAQTAKLNAQSNEEAAAQRTGKTAQNSNQAPVNKTVANNARTTFKVRPDFIIPTMQDHGCSPKVWGTYLAQSGKCFRRKLKKAPAKFSHNIYC